MTALISLHMIRLPASSDDDRRAYDQRLRDALGIEQIEIPLSVMRRLSSLARKGADFPCVVGSRGRTARLVDVGSGKSYSLALDLGSTNLAALLYDNRDGRTVLVKSLENPQVAYGSDILTRMHHAMSAHGKDVYDALTDGMNGLIAAVCREAGIERRMIHGMAVAGNTVMTHFSLGLDIGTIPVDPFIPVVRKPGFLTASDLSLDINPEAVVFVFPNAGSYVGGDIAAGIVASGMFQAEAPSILIDVGTNAEVVIGNRDWMIVGAGAAGPALEEGISRIGKRANRGIVYDIEIRSGKFSCKTFDERPPEGICGSGMVSLLYELHTAGMIDRRGNFLSGKHVRERNGEPTFAIDCGRGEPLTITQPELQNFIKSKAAMFTLLLVLTRSVGITFGDVEHVYVSGALGTGIDPVKAVGIGMLPAWPSEIVQPLGNSSLEGARLLLADADTADAVNSLVDRITYKHMHDDPEFMREYMGAVFLPHTNPDLLRVG